MVGRVNLLLCQGEISHGWRWLESHLVWYFGDFDTRKDTRKGSWIAYRLHFSDRVKDEIDQLSQYFLVYRTNWFTRS